MLLLLALVSTADAQQLPPPHAVGGHCQLLTPCAESGPFAAHVRGLLELREADGQRFLQWGGHLGLSFSFFDWGEGGVSLYGLYGAAGLSQGPVTLWGRVSPPFLHWTGGEDDVAALRLAVQVEYAAAFPPFDGKGTLFPQTHTYLAVADATAWRIRASLSAGPQLGDGAGPGYRGLQAGAGVWLKLDGAGLQFGGEVLGRAGTQAGSWRQEWTAALSVRMYDVEGHQMKGGFALPSSGGGSILVGYGFSCGPSYPASSCFRGWGRSLFERTQDRLGAAILASGRAFEPPPPTGCPPDQPAIRIYPCRRSAPYMLGTTVPLQVGPPPEAEPREEREELREEGPDEEKPERPGDTVRIRQARPARPPLPVGAQVGEGDTIGMPRGRDGQVMPPPDPVRRLRRRRHR